MDTIPVDLINLVTDYLEVSSIILLGLNTNDNQEYLDLVTDNARFKLAIKNNNIGWIHQTLKGCDQSNEIWILLNLFKKYKLDKLSEHSLDLNKVSKYHNWDIVPSSEIKLCDTVVPLTGYNGWDIIPFSKIKLGDTMIPLTAYQTGLQGIEYTQDFSRDLKEYLEGLAVGGHIELFKKYILLPQFDSLKFRELYQILMIFEDKNYIDDVISSLIKHTPPSIHIDPCMDIDIPIIAGRDDIALFLSKKISSGFYIRNFSVFFCFAINAGHDKVWMYNNISKDDIDLYIYEACIHSNTKLLDLTYKNLHKIHRGIFIDILSKSLITKELHQYALEKFGIKVPLDMDLVNKFLLLKPYMDTYKNYYFPSYAVIKPSTNIFDYVTNSLLLHYIKIENFDGFKAIYNIIVVNLNAKELSDTQDVETHIRLEEINFLKCHCIYANMKVSELKSKAKDMGIKGYQRMNKSQLVAALMSFVR